MGSRTTMPCRGSDVSDTFIETRSPKGTPVVEDKKKLDHPTGLGSRVWYLCSGTLKP